MVSVSETIAGEAGEKRGGLILRAYESSGYAAEPSINANPAKDWGCASATGHAEAPLAANVQIEAALQIEAESPIEKPRHPVGGPAKRAMDIAMAATAALLMAPILLFITALIYCTMGRPILFSQQRVGFKGKTFACYKFRSMVNEADKRLQDYLAQCPQAAHDWATNQKLADDPRVTLLGKVLRKSSLDELPQLFNILRGDMSCIGPRPVLPAELSGRYGVSAADYMRARPGLTGLWQVSGRSSTSYGRRIAYDRYYVRRWSMPLDLGILLRTIPALFKTGQTS